MNPRSGKPERGFCTVKTRLAILEHRSSIGRQENNNPAYSNLDRVLRICYSRIHTGAHSSAGEHCLHTAGVAGSNPAAPTNKNKGLADKASPL